MGIEEKVNVASATPGEEETTPKETTNVETPSTETPGKEANGGEQTPNKKTPIQARIDRMYARMKSAEAKVKETPKPKAKTPYDDDYEEEEKVVDPVKIQDIVKQTIAQENRNIRYAASERKVIENLSNILNDDGSYDFNDPFVKKYIEIGQRNPQLATMENGPELAAAMVEKELGIDYKRSRTDEANRVPSDGHISKSTTGAPRKTNSAQDVKNLSPAELNAANRTGMTPEEYVEWKNKSVIK